MPLVLQKSNRAGDVCVSCRLVLVVEKQLKRSLLSANEMNSVN